MVINLKKLPSPPFDDKLDVSARAFLVLFVNLATIDISLAKRKLSFSRDFPQTHERVPQ